MDIKTYKIEDILNTKIHPLYVTEEMITIKEFMWNIFLNLVDENYDSDYINELISTLFIGFVENKFINGFVNRDKAGYLEYYDYNYSDAVKLYKILIKYFKER